MSPGPDAPDDLNPAERRLEEHLETLRSDHTGPDRSLAARVVRTARWQRVVRVPLRVVGMIAGAFVDGLGVAAGRSERR